MNSFDSMRTEFLKGKENLPDITDCIEFHHNLETRHNSNCIFQAAAQAGKIVIQGNYGFPTLEEHGAFYNQLTNSLPNQEMIYSLTIDSAEERTRNLQHISLTDMRNFVENTPAPIQIRSGKSDQRLLAEKAFASGISDIMGGAITNSAYSFDRISLEKGFAYWQYIDRLIALYDRKGVTVSKEVSLPLTGNLIPPSLQLSLVILDGLISIENGVKSLTLSYNQGGNLMQDISALKLLSKLSQHYINFCFGDKKEVQDDLRGIMPKKSLATWSAGFPDDTDRGFAIIGMAGMVGALGESDKIITTSPERGKGNVSADSYVQGKKTAAQSIDMTVTQKIDQLENTVEYQNLQASVISIIDGVLSQIDREEQSLAQAVLQSFHEGILDVPFSSMIENLGYVLPFRAIDGSVGYFDCGNLPLPDDVVQYNDRCLRQRAAQERRKPTFQMVIDDIYAAGKGQLR